jgi:hypothetical protein
MFDKFKKDEGGEATEEKFVEQTNMKSNESSANETVGEIGIVELMDKRVKLEEAIDYVGLMIKNLKDKRTVLEKDIEKNQ